MQGMKSAPWKQYLSCQELQAKISRRRSNPGKKVSLHPVMLAWYEYHMVTASRRTFSVPYSLLLYSNIKGH